VNVPEGVRDSFYTALGGHPPSTTTSMGTWDRALEAALEQLREELEGEGDKYEAAARDEDPAPYKLNLAKAEGIDVAVNSVLGDKEEGSPRLPDEGGGLK
jgi:hypothetical protein